AVSYALKSKFRTGMTIAIFALVIFTITTMSMIIGMMGTNIERQVQEASGGYEVLGFSSPNLPIYNITKELQDKGLESKVEKYSALISGNVNISPTIDSGEIKYYSIIGVDDSFIEENEFYFSEYLSEYGSEKDLWYAIRNNESLVVIDGTFGAQNNFVSTGSSLGNFSLNVGDTIKIIDKDNSIVEKKLIGVLDTTIIQGIFSYNKYVDEGFNINTSSVFLFSIKKGQDADKIAKEIESSFL
ncbi:MAG: hypothetical protein MUO82_09080, partial [Candidatus Thermoplasmatota archaeon]|nr:hypothetical protein [Candidatus Thermoplasmatota archaeon]